MPGIKEESLVLATRLGKESGTSTKAKANVLPLSYRLEHSSKIVKLQLALVASRASCVRDKKLAGISHEGEL